MTVPPILEQAYRLQTEGRFAEAETLYARALIGIRNNPVLWFNHGLVLRELGRLAEAMASYDSALALNPRDAQALNGRGLLRNRMGRTAEALADFDRALAVDPKLVPVQFNHATALTGLKRNAEAHAAFQKIHAQHPAYLFALDGLWGTTLHLCDWETRRTLEPQLPAHVAMGRPLTPFNLLLALDDPALQRQAATSFARRMAAAPAAPRGKSNVHGGRLRLGYLSYDFRYHPVSSSNAAVLERHDRARFEVFAFSTGPDDASPMRRRLEQGFEHFIDVSGRGDSEIAAQIAAAQIDVLVDLGGHTTGARPGVLAARPAPVQVNYQGWPGTLGTDFIDYIIADGTVIPPGHESHFAETVVRLPHCYMPSDPTRTIAETPTRASAGLPENAFVFCAFNSCWKITPALFDVWMQLLQAVPGSVLWLRIDGDEAIANLRREAAARDIAPERLVAAPRAEEADHLARHRLADLFLDTFPFTGHSTAIDALAAGLPLVAMAGQGFAARVSASVLAAAGVPEFAVATMAEYHALALTLARDAQARAQYRSRLAGVQDTELFDATGLCRALESAYARMAEIARSGGAPEAFTVTG
jgi:predicted O-linked N-acetylglucosamine transferase (SPINDLY family)